MSDVTLLSDYTPISCRFTLSPMADDFVEIILGAIGKVDTGMVTARTGKLSTVYQGLRPYVEDGVKACFVHAWRPEVHMTMEAVYSRGWPGEALETVGPEKGAAPNAGAVGKVHFPMAAKVSLYAMGEAGFAEGRKELGRLAREMGVYEGEEPDCVVLGGDVQGVFGCVEGMDRWCAEHLGWYALGVTYSVNSPTA